MDRRLFKPLSQWSLDDIAALIAERVPEGQRLEYKEALAIERDSERIELAKDLSGMANAQGGLIIYGVAEDNSDEPRPVAVRPLPLEGQQTRLEDIIDSAVQPKLDYTCRPIDVEGGLLLLVRVAPRVAGPHMIQSYKQHRYFVRRGTRTVPMAEEDVRAAYMAARGREESVLALVNGLPLMPRITRLRSVDELEASSRGISRVTWLPVASVVTAPFDGPRELLDPDHLAAAAFPEPAEQYVAANRRLRGQGYFRLDALGLVEEAKADVRNILEVPADMAYEAVINRVRLFRQGVCEWVHRYVGGPDPYSIPSTAFAWDVHNALAYFASVYAAVGYAGRLAVWVRVDNAEKAWLAVNRQLGDLTRDDPTGLEWIGANLETTVDALLSDPLPLVREAMQRIWKAFGNPRCLLFDEAGDWTAAARG